MSLCLEIFHSMRRGLELSDHKLDWRHTFGEGSALEQLLACRVLRAALEGEPVRMVSPGTREQSWLLAPLEGDFTEDIRDLCHREQLEGHEAVVARLHQPALFPAEAARASGQSSGGRVLVRVPRSEDQERAA